VFAKLTGAVIVLLGIINPVQAKSPEAPQKARIEYSQSPNTLVISYTRHVGEIAHADRGPSLRIYGDGVAYVHYPLYMTKAGDYTFQLSKSEMLGLFDSLVGDGVIEFDSERARKKQRQSDRLQHQTSTVMHYVSDPPVALIEMNLVSYTRPGANTLQQTNLHKVVHWSGLQSDAEQYPQHMAIQKLAAAERRLRELMEQPGLVRLDTSPQRINIASGKD